MEKPLVEEGEGPGAPSDHKALDLLLFDKTLPYDKTIPAKVRSYLESLPPLPPLTPISTSNLYLALDVPKHHMVNIRAALHSVSAKSNPRHYYDVRLKFVSEACSILSLPGGGTGA